MKPIPAPSFPEAIPLYGAAQPAGEPEQWMSGGDDRLVRNVVSPALIPVLPAAGKATGAGVIVLPGGGFRLLAIDNEGLDAAHWLAERGIAAFVVKYRLLPTPREMGGDPFGGAGGPRAAGEQGGRQGGQGGAAKTEGPGDAKPQLTPGTMQCYEDAKAALELVRGRAAEWKVDPARLGALGFSAGAIIALELALGEEKIERPAFVGVIYGPLGARKVPDDAPPMFAVLAADDFIMSGLGFELVKKYREAERPIEFHLYEMGGHAFGMRQRGTTSDLWAEQFYAWLKERGELESAAR